jgi:hypothetical protein
VNEAAAQIKRDVGREVMDKVAIPTASGKEYLIKNLREVIEDPSAAVTPASKATAKHPSTYGSTSTQRLIVAPRPPSDTSMARELGREFCVEYIEALMAKKDLRLASQALANALEL